MTSEGGRTECCFDDLVLGEESREGRNTKDCQPATGEGQPGDLHGGAQGTKATHIDLVIHSVHDGTRTKEHECLEETVSEEVENREDPTDGAKARTQHHVADLAHGRGRKNLLHIVLGTTNNRAKEQRDCTDDDNRGSSDRRCLEDRARTNNQVDTGGNHRCRVDKRGHRGRTGHCVTQPSLQGELRRLTASTHQKEETDDGCLNGRNRCGRCVHFLDVDGREVSDHRHHCNEQAHITDAVHHECLLRGNRIGGNVVPETDEQVRGQAHAFPSDEETRVGVCKHQDEHGGDEEVEVGEETATRIVMSHVSDGVDVDKRTDEGDQHDEGHRQRIDHQAEVHRELARGNPREKWEFKAARIGGCGEHGDNDAKSDSEGCPRCQSCQEMAPAIGAASAYKEKRTGNGGDRNHEPCQGNDSRGLAGSCDLCRGAEKCQCHSGLLLSSSADRGRQRL